VRLRQSLILTVFGLCSCLNSPEVSPCSDGANPGTWEISYDGQPFQPASVPGYWHEFASFPNTGIADYRLKINCTLRKEIDAVEFRQISAAGIISWNDVEIGRSGIPGASRSSESGRIAPIIVQIPDPGPGVLRVHVSNFHARGGGILGFAFGDLQSFRSKQSMQIFGEGFVLGLINAIGLFFLFYFILRRESWSHFLFWVLIALWTVRSIASNSILEQFFPYRDWTDFRLLAEYITAVAAMPPIFFSVVYLLVRVEVSEGILGSLRHYSSVLIAGVYIPGGMALSLFFTINGDASYYGLSQPAYVTYYLIPGLAVCLIFLILSVADRKDGAGWLLIGYAGVLFATLIDAETTVRGQANTLLVPLGLLFFAISFAITVFLRIQRDRHEMKTLRAERFLAQGLKNRGELRNLIEARKSAGRALLGARRTALHIERLMHNRVLSQDDGLTLMDHVQRLIRRIEPIALKHSIEDTEPVNLKTLIVAQSQTYPLNFLSSTEEMRILANYKGLSEVFREACALSDGDAFTLRAEPGLRITLEFQFPGQVALETLAIELKRSGARIESISESAIICSFQKTDRTDLSDLPFRERHRRLLGSIGRR